MITRLSMIALAAFAASAVLAADPAPSFNANQILIKEKPEFMASIGVQSDKVQPLTKQEKRVKTEAAFNEKNAQHFMSLHYQKGLSCVSCHDQHSISDPAWMIVVGKPVIKQDCQSCHKVQADVVAHTDTHDKLDCVACHLPNVKADASAESKDAEQALRRIHTYKILVDPEAKSFKEVEVEVDGKKVKGYELAKDDEGHGYVDLMWSCARNTPADYTVFEGQGCHDKTRSTLDEGLVFKTQKQVYGEVQKWQEPVKETYKRVVEGSKRISKLLEVTKLTREDQTEVRLLVDKANDIAAMVKEDGSWGVHGSNYLKDKILTAEAFLNKAQGIIDMAGFQKTSNKK